MMCHIGWSYDSIRCICELLKNIHCEVNHREERLVKKSTFSFKFLHQVRIPFYFILIEKIIELALRRNKTQDCMGLCDFAKLSHD